MILSNFRNRNTQVVKIFTDPNDRFIRIKPIKNTLQIISWINIVRRIIIQTQRGNIIVNRINFSISKIFVRLMKRIDITKRGKATKRMIKNHLFKSIMNTFRNLFTFELSYGTKNRNKKTTSFRNLLTMVLDTKNWTTAFYFILF